jgi:phosphohistidine phosphatase
MKRLLLLRHAQTMPSDGLHDKERKLTPIGILDARALGSVMARKKYQPDQVLCSPAARTRETLEGLMESLNTVSILYLLGLYEEGQDEMLETIRKADDDVNTLMIVAHNPSTHSLALALAQDDSSPFLNKLASGYKPGTLSVLQCPIEKWRDLNPRENVLADLLEPLDYNASSASLRRV